MTTQLVVDASVAVAAVATPFGFERLRGFELVAPPLLWVEAVSVLHAASWRGELRPERALEMRDRIIAAPIVRTDPERLAACAWVLADEFGWAKTYDANYVALARMLSCRFGDARRAHAAGDGAARLRRRPHRAVAADDSLSCQATGRLKPRPQSATQRLRSRAQSENRRSVRVPQ